MKKRIKLLQIIFAKNIRMEFGCLRVREGKEFAEQFRNSVKATIEADLRGTRIYGESF